MPPISEMLMLDAVHVPQEEKRVLEGMAEWFKDRQTRLDKLEYYHGGRLSRTICCICSHASASALLQTA